MIWVPAYAGRAGLGISNPVAYLPQGDAMAAVVELQHVRKAFGPTLVLGDVSLALEAGTITAILGGNGAGKSTLLKIMGGVIAPTSGDVQAGAPMRRVRTVREALAAGVRFIHQEGSLIPAWTVAEHFYAGGWESIATGVAGSARIDQLDAHDRQLLESARALQGKPAVVLADEPTAGLGPEERDRVFAARRRLSDALDAVNNRYGEFIVTPANVAPVCARAGAATTIRANTNAHTLRFMLTDPQRNTPPL